MTSFHNKHQHRSKQYQKFRRLLSSAGNHLDNIQIQTWPFPAFFATFVRKGKKKRTVYAFLRFRSNQSISANVSDL